MKKLIFLIIISVFGIEVYAQQIETTLNVRKMKVDKKATASNVEVIAVKIGHEVGKNEQSAIMLENITLTKTTLPRIDGLTNSTLILDQSNKEVDEKKSARFNKSKLILSKMKNPKYIKTTTVKVQ